MSPYIETAAVALTGLVVVAGWRFLIRSIKREIQDVVTQIVSPELEKINKRIDEHMKSEEGDLKRLIEVLSVLSGEDEDTLKGKIRGD